MFDAVELLNDYTFAAREAILDVTDGSIGAGENPLAFVICAFRSQAAKIKELTGNGSQDQSTRYQSRELGDSSLRQPTDVTYGPTEKDGGCFIYWGGKCRGKLMPQYDASKGE